MNHTKEILKLACLVICLIILAGTSGCAHKGYGPNDGYTFIQYITN